MKPSLFTHSFVFVFVFCTITAMARAQDAPKPVATPGPPFVILKLDDLTSASPAWKRTVEFLAGKKIKSSIGIIGNSLQNDRADYRDWIKNIQDEGLVEFWNHGWDHKQWKEGGKDLMEFKGPSYEQQKEHIERSQQMAKDALGITLRTFGAPFNQTDQATVKVLAENSDLKVWLYGDRSAAASLPHVLVLDRTKMNIENPTFVPNFEQLKSDYAALAKTRDYFVIQGHPNEWNEARFEDFKKIVEYLAEQGVTFTTPYDYYLYRQTPEGKAAQDTFAQQSASEIVTQPSRPAAGSNLLVNGDFESGQHPWQLFAPDVQDVCELTISTDQPHGGAAAGELTSTDSVRYAMVNYAKVGTFQPGKRYRVSAWVRAGDDFEALPGTPGFLLRVSMFADQGAAFTPEEAEFYLGTGNRTTRGGDVSHFVDQSVPQEWTKIEGVLDVTPETAKLNVCVFVWKGSGSFQVDDVVLEEVDGETPLSSVDGLTAPESE